MRVGYLSFLMNDQARDARITALQQKGCEQVIVDELPNSAAPRMQLRQLLETLEAGDTLVVWSLGHLGLRSKEVIGILGQFETHGIRLIAVRDQVDTVRDPAIGLFCRVLIEVDSISHRARTHSGLKAAIERGAKIGRPSAIGDEERMVIEELHAAGVPKRRIARKLSLARSTLERYFEAKRNDKSAKAE